MVWAVDEADEEMLRKKVMARAPRAPRVRLDRLADVPDRPGVYLQFLATERMPYLGVVGEGRVACYVGAGQSLRERMNRYRLSLRGVTLIGEANLHVALLLCPTEATALAAERILIDELRPLLNGLGWGSKHQGNTRRHQRCSPVDVLFGRSWARPPTPSQRIAVHSRIIRHLASMDPAATKWPALPLAESGEPRSESRRGSADPSLSPS